MGLLLRAVRRCREQQARCAALINTDQDYPGGARLGASDWLMEEILILEENKRPQLIGLCGYMGVGKDAAAALLSMIGYLRMSFADQIRIEVLESVTSGLFPIQAIGNEVVAADIRALVGSGDTVAIYAKPTSESMRRILQWWGTDFRRKQDPEYWTEQTMGRFDASDYRPVVISDVRFPNEAAAIRKRGGVIWRITRTGSGGDTHVSETVIDDIKPDKVIGNDGTLIELAGKLLFELGNEAKPKRGRPVGSKTKPQTVEVIAVPMTPEEMRRTDVVFKENPEVDTLSNPPIATLDEAPWGSHADGSPLHGPSGLPIAMDIDGPLVRRDGVERERDFVRENKYAVFDRT